MADSRLSGVIQVTFSVKQLRVYFFSTHGCDYTRKSRTPMNSDLLKHCFCRHEW